MKNFLAKIVFLLALTPFAVHAILPLVIGGLVMATNSTTLTTALVGSAAVIGAAVAFIGMGGDPATTPPANSPLLVKINPSEPMPTPSGWTAPVAPSTEPKAPNVALNTPDPAYPQTSTDSSCSEPVGTQIYYIPEARYRKLIDDSMVSAHQAAGWSFIASCGSPNIGKHRFGHAVAACPTGYTSNGSQCVATPGAVTKPADSKCTIIRTGNTFSADPVDPDCTAGLPATVSVTGTEVVVNPSATQKQSVKINGDGTTTATTTTINTTNNTTTTNTTNINNGGGVGNSKITGIGTSTVNGTGDQAGTTPTIEFPTDYNREVTQQGIKTTLDQIKAGQCGATGQPACKLDETGTPTDGSLTAAQSAIDAAFADVVTGVNNIGGSAKINDLGVGLPLTLPNTACENPTFAMPKGHGNLVVPLCSVSTDVQAIMAWIMAALTLVSLWRCAAEATRD